MKGAAESARHVTDGGSHRVGRIQSVHVPVHRIDRIDEQRSHACVQNGILKLGSISSASSPLHAFFFKKRNMTRAILIRFWGKSCRECVQTKEMAQPPPKRARTRSTHTSANNSAKSPSSNNSIPLMPPPFIMRIVKNNMDSKVQFTTEEQQYMQRFGKPERARMDELLQRMKPSTEPRRIRVLRSKLPIHVKADIFRQLADNETVKYEEWVEHALRLPYGKYTPPPKTKHPEFIQKARAKMDEEITGHDDAKHEVLRLICSWLNNGASSGFAIGLEGEPGVGKTSFVKRALSQCMGRPFCFIGLGGASDASGLLGHGYTYEGAIPGRLAECLTTSKVMDPIIYFDELDKISATGKGDELVHALIHLTDPIQNEHIRDRYLHGINLDLSRAVLVFSYNDASRVNPVLLDRIKRIRLNRPTNAQRMQICKNHLIPRALLNFPDSNLTLSTEVIDYIVHKNERESGMRGIEKDIAHIIASYCLVQMYGSTEVLGLSLGMGSLDLAFASSVLRHVDQCSTSHLLMYN